MSIRIGHGYDVHKFGGLGPIVIAGVKIEHDMGLIAHSDGDVVLHALCDALLGALALGDIGKHFPDTDPTLAGVDSRKLLRLREVQLRGRALKEGNLLSDLLYVDRNLPALDRLATQDLACKTVDTSCLLCSLLSCVVFCSLCFFQCAGLFRLECVLPRVPEIQRDQLEDVGAELAQVGAPGIQNRLLDLLEPSYQVGPRHLEVDQ